jgi:hypothetical protein
MMTSIHRLTAVVRGAFAAPTWYVASTPRRRPGRVKETPDA